MGSIVKAECQATVTKAAVLLNSSADKTLVWQLQSMPLKMTMDYFLLSQTAISKTTPDFPSLPD